MAYRGSVAVVVGVVALTLGTAKAPAYEPPVPPNRVTVITDSVAGIVWWMYQAHPELAAGFDLDIQTRTCRKLVEPGCFAYGESPPSALATIAQLGDQLGPTVVMDVGYND